MNKKKDRRVTIYDIARQIGIAPSSVSKALNDQPTISDKIKALVKSKVQELNYVHNSSAANLRRGTSRTIGVIVPKINTAFFSDVIAGMEEACFENNHHLIICQSGESYIKEVQAVETLIHQNVDCIIISISIETKSSKHLEEIGRHHVNLIQFDRVDHAIPSHTIVNDNKNAAYKAVKHLIDMGYKKIALLGGADFLTIYRDRKEGYLKAIKEAELLIPYNYIVDNALTTDRGMDVAKELLKSNNPPDAFFTISDYSALGVLRVALSMKLKVPEQIGIMGFANEPFTELISPGLSSVDQKSRKMGKDAVNVYFNYILQQKPGSKFRKQVIESSLVIRESSMRKMIKLHK
ncbi:MAG: LacI family DNA-binding transcriptional regulator [Chitinophagaceae bacterium]